VLGTVWDLRSKGARDKVVVLADAACTGALALFLAVNFAFGRGPMLVELRSPGTILFYAVIFGALSGVMAFATGLHRSIWRFTSLFDFINILRATTLTVFCFLPVVFLSTRAADLPRSAPIIAWFLAVAFSGAPRIIARALTDRTTPLPLLTRRVHAGSANVPVLLVGQANRIEAFVRELMRQPSSPYAVVGVLTYESAWHGHHIHGVGVLGGTQDLATALAFLQQRRIRPQRLIIADDHADEQTISGFLEMANRHGLTLGRLPGLTDFGSAEAKAAQTVQPVALADLLGRPQVVLDTEAMRSLISGRRVLITGAGGSIGSELVRQVSDLAPERLILVDSSEFNLYAIDMELGERHPKLLKRSALCDVRDRNGLEYWFMRERPEIVFHAAALKHVPLVEAHPIQGVRTNVLGTQNVADACVQHGAAVMVLISTDKAVNPHNVMGATKRCAESYCQALDAEGSRTRFVAVRFGNVLGSTGSVVPLFQRQLAAGGPLTVTHPEITRYFMTIPEAVALVLQASAIGAREDMRRGAVFVLDMGKPIKIADLARQLIRLSGKRPDVDVQIRFVGLRPGEKLHEELVHDEERISTPGDGVLMVTPRTAHLPILKQQFAELGRASDHLDQDRVLRLLTLMVPEFTTRREIRKAAAGEADMPGVFAPRQSSASAGEPLPL
jgi:FlaA1/EpsC-like NDP-sugar epimerase